MNRKNFATVDKNYHILYWMGFYYIIRLDMII